MSGDKLNFPPDATIKLDPMGMSRGFGFVLFEEESSVDACLAAGELTLKEKKIEGEWLLSFGEGWCVFAIAAAVLLLLLLHIE